MTIRPIVLNGTIQRTQDVGNLKQQEDAKPHVDQQNIQSTMAKQEQRLSSQVIETKKSEQEEFRYDAKEKGSSAYKKNNGKKKKKEWECCVVAVIVKGATSGFDIKI